MLLTLEELTQQDLSKLSPQELEELFTPEQIQEVLAKLGGEDDYQRLLEEQQDRQLDPIRFYKPNKAQDRFHLAQNARGYTPKLRLFEAGNKVGKSASAMIEGISFSRGFRSWLPEDHPLYKTPITGAGRVPQAPLPRGGCDAIR
ncbi:hypothetical protein MYX64_04580 [Nitrospinae bacterium AH_259_B05_G02_I21]|nr:hypothetical protein [Nitrospinae bacterium AH_259_B05_G02_I21]